MDKDLFYTVAAIEFARSWTERPETTNALDARIKTLECLKDAVDAVMDEVKDAAGSDCENCGARECNCGVTNPEERRRFCDEDEDS